MYLCFRRHKSVVKCLLLIVITTFTVLLLLSNGLDKKNRPTRPVSTSSTRLPWTSSLWQFEPTCRRFDNRSDIPTKIVLLWTRYFGNWSDHFDMNGGPFTELEMYGNMKRCFFTSDRRNYLQNASALLFHGRDIFLFDLPEKRFPWQRYVYYLHESPSQIYIDIVWEKINAIGFNWTMSYSKKGNVYFPYGIIRRSKKPLDVAAADQKIRNFTTSFRSRPTDAVWIVSNCYTKSFRHRYVEALRELGIIVDVFGNCGKLGRPDDIYEKIGERQFFSNYRFYLSLENALCEDYITEKAFHGFYANFIAGPIPIVYGGGNYRDFFLEGSYVNVEDFENVTDLAMLMKNLTKTAPKELEPYYEWHKAMNPAYDHYFELVEETDIFRFHPSKRAGWRNLCKKLWDDDTSGTNSVVDNIRDQLGQCRFANASAFGDIGFLPNVGKF